MIILVIQLCNLVVFREYYCIPLAHSARAYGLHCTIACILPPRAPYVRTRLYARLLGVGTIGRAVTMVARTWEVDKVRAQVKFLGITIPSASGVMVGVQMHRTVISSEIWIPRGGWIDAWGGSFCESQPG